MAVELFAGVGGFALALEGNGIPVVAAVEIDPHARGVYRHNFPNTQLFKDVKDVTGEQLRATGFVPERGILTGGFPCQDLSVAGKRAGLAGNRSGLFWEIDRLLGELQPQFVILENVPGLLSSNSGRDFGLVLNALVERGYGVAYRVLDLQHFGAPQRRRRVFIVGSLGDERASEILALSESLCGDSETGDETGQDPAGDVGECAEDGVIQFGNGRRGHDQVRHGGVTNTLLAHMGTGGNNVPMAAVERERERESYELSQRGDLSPRLARQSGCERRNVDRVYGQTGFAKYTEDEVTTLTSSNAKRAEDNLVVHQNSEVGGTAAGRDSASGEMGAGGGLPDRE